MHVVRVTLERRADTTLTRQNGRRWRLADGSHGFGRKVDDIIGIQQALRRSARGEHGDAHSIVEGHGSGCEERMGNSLGMEIFHTLQCVYVTEREGK